MDDFFSLTSYGAIDIVKTFQGSSDCKLCKQPFITEVSEYSNGKRLKANVCDSCSAARDAFQPTDTKSERRKLDWDQRVGGYFSIFDPQRLPEKTRQHAERVLKWTPSSKGIGLLGKSHSGKSKCIMELGRRLYIDGHDVYPTSAIEFQEIVIGQVSRKEEYEAYINRVKNCKILLMDDCDKYNPTPAVEASMFSVLETRRRFERPILVTVNINGQAMAQNGSQNRGEPIVNRLRDLCEIIELK